MEVKTSTKEVFHVIGITTPLLAANMTEELCNRLNTYLQNPIRNIVLNLEGVISMEESAAECLVKTQQAFYEKGASFVICALTPALEALLDDYGLLEVMNVTPTESEASDIVQMEEIERELMDE